MARFCPTGTTVRVKIGSSLDVELLAALKDWKPVALEGHRGKLWMVISRNARRAGEQGPPGRPPGASTAEHLEALQGWEMLRGGVEFRFSPMLPPGRGVLLGEDIVREYRELIKEENDA